jgi:tRNA A37 methylthiotransferase MiaB
VDLLQKTKYDLAFLFAYSEREKTHAARHLVDDVAHAVKIERLQELIATYRSELCKKGEKEVGKCHLVLVEGPSRRSETVLTGRTDTFKRVVFDDIGVCPSLVGLESDSSRVNLGIGDYAAVKIVDGGGGGSMKGVALARTSIKEFVDVYGSAVPSITLI